MKLNHNYSERLDVTFKISVFILGKFLVVSNTVKVRVWRLEGVEGGGIKK